jgi:ATP-dependent RNA helicase DDX10/DBP4
MRLCYWTSVFIVPSSLTTFPLVCNLIILIANEVLLYSSQVPIKVIKANPTKIQSISQGLAGVLSQDPELKHTAQRAFVSYLRSINLQPNKEVFDVTRLAITEFAASLGLPNAPRIRMKKKGKGKEEKGLDNKPQEKVAKEGGESDRESGSEDEEDVKGDGGVNAPSTSKQEKKRKVDEEFNGSDGAKVEKRGATKAPEVEVEEDPPKQGKKRSRMERLFDRKNADVLSDAYQKLRASDDDDAADVSGDEVGDLLRVKRMNHGLDGEDGDSTKGVLVKLARLAPDLKPPLS